MPRKIIVNKGDIYGVFEIIKEINPLITPKGENKRNFLVKCNNCKNDKYIILLNHLRQRDLPSCDLCNNKNTTNTSYFLNKD